MCTATTARSTRTSRGDGDLGAPLATGGPPRANRAPAGEQPPRQSRAHEQVEVLIDPRRELVPELGRDALSDAKMEEMNPDQAAPQMAAPRRQYAAKHDRADDEGAQSQGKGISGATGDGQHG